MRRSRRVGFERLRYAAAYRCEICKDRVCVSHWQHWCAKKYVSCPNCGERDLTVLARRDKVDRMNRSPFRLLQHLLGARLYHCRHCRLQFYDLRGLRASAQSRARAAG